FIGQSKADTSASDVRQQLPAGASLVQFDNKDTGWSAGISYALSNRLALQAYYVDLGDSTLSLSGETLDPSQFQQAVAGIGPQLAQGVRLGASYRLWQHDKWQLAAQGGLFSWKSEQRSVVGNSTSQQDNDGTDVY